MTKENKDDDPCDDWSDRQLPKKNTDSGKCTA